MDQTHRLYRVAFERVRVPPDHILGRIDYAWPAIRRVLDKATIGLCAEMIGGAQKVLDMEHDAHLCLKRAKAAEVTFGDASFHRERVAQLIGL